MSREYFAARARAQQSVQWDMRDVVLAERERIIELAQNKVCFDNRDTSECDHSVCYGMIDLIVLIKGEDK